MNKLNDLLNEIKNANFQQKDQIIEYLNKVKQLITPLKPFEHYKKFNNELILNDYKLIKSKLLHENEVEIDDDLNVNCNNCKNCFVCYNCNDCKNCKYCYECNDCNDCCNCNNCHDCDDCNGCHCCCNCNYCNDCHYCNNCNDCNNCHDCDNYDEYDDSD